MTDKFLRLAAVMDQTGLSKSALYKLLQENRFPPGIRIGRTRAWPQSTITEWQLQIILANEAQYAAYRERQRAAQK